MVHWQNIILYTAYSFGTDKKISRIWLDDKWVSMILFSPGNNHGFIDFNFMSFSISSSLPYASRYGFEAPLRMS